MSECGVDLKGTKGEGPASVVLRKERPVLGRVDVEN